MAKSVMEQLLALCTPEEQAAIKAKLDANPSIAVNDRRMADLFGIYLNEEGEGGGTPNPEPHTPAVPSAAAPATPPVAAAPAAAAAPATPAAPTTNANKEILDMLGSVKTSLETKLADLEKNSIKITDLPKYEGAMLEKTIRNAHLAARIEREHHAAFNEDLDLDKLGEFINEQGKKGVKFADIKSAYDKMVEPRVIEAKIAAGIAEGVKQKTSAVTVPGQSQSSALSPAQQVIAKAKAAATSTEGKTNLQSAIDRLKTIDDSNAATVQ